MGQGIEDQCKIVQAIPKLLANGLLKSDADDRATDKKGCCGISHGSLHIVRSEDEERRSER